MDNHRALDVGELHRGTGICKVRNPNVPEGGSEVTIRESPDVLPLRAEVVNTFKAYVDVNHMKLERWGLPGATGMLSARRCTRASKEKIGKKCMTPTRQGAKLWRGGREGSRAGGSEGKSFVGHESSQGQKGRVL